MNMNTVSGTRNETRAKPWLHWAANVMVALGVVALGAAAYNGVRAANLYHSPFDVVEGPEGSQEKGFLPLVVDEGEQAAGRLHAPTLAVGEEEGMDAAKMEEVKAALASNEKGESREEGEVLVPERIVIPSLNVDAPVLVADYKEVSFWGKTYKQWLAPNKKAVGWHFESAPLGVVGNTVLNGHHNVYGEVFRQLGEITQGSIIYLYAGERAFSYIVVTVQILDEKYQEVEVRLENAQWTARSEDERVTLVSCWPYDGNSQRVVVVAVPIELDGPVP